MRTRRDRATRPWHLIVLGLGAAALIVLAVTAIGPPAGGSRTSTELVSAADGVVQSTVSGTGNVEAGTDVAVNFQTSGTLSQVFVKVGQHVGQGQLLAELDPTAAQLGVDQAQASLTSAQDQLSALQTAAATAGTTTTGTSASTPVSATTEFVSAVTTRPKNPGGGSTPGGGTHTNTHTTPSTTTPTSITPAPSTHTSTTPTATSTTPSRASSSGSGAGGGTTTTQATPPSPASIASAQAAVDSAEVAVRSAEDALSKTKLYAPAAGTIVSLASDTPGDTISAGSTGTPSVSSGSGGGSGGGGSSGGSGSGGTGAGASSSGSGSGGGSSSTPFAEIVDSSTMTMTVAFSESDITKVHVGQPATVSIDALSGVELAAHVASISTVGTSSNGVVSYNATLDLDQNDGRVRPGMSATATVITAQAQGLTVPLQALTGAGSLATVNVMRSGKAVSQQVVVGLRGDTRAQIVSGLNAGQQLVITITLPSLGTSSGTSGTGVLGGGRFGGGGLGGLGGGGAFLRSVGGGGLGGGRGG